MSDKVGTPSNDHRSMPTHRFYELPCSPNILCHDRFGILDEETDLVAFWVLFRKLTLDLIDSEISIESLIDYLDTIHVLLWGHSLTDYGSLRRALSGSSPKRVTGVWRCVLSIALEMPELFPDAALPVLCHQHPVLTMSRRQTACLVLHQTLCTMQQLPWRKSQDRFASTYEDQVLYQNFGMWYPMEQPHPAAIDIYLKSLLNYLAQLSRREHESCSAATRTTHVTGIEYRLSSWSSLSREPLTVPVRSGEVKASFCRLTVERVQEYETLPKYLGTDDNAYVISANRDVGFGISATQEELHAGTSPESCPLVLVTPPLGEDEVAIVTGAECMTHAKGIRRRCRYIGPLVEEDGHIYQAHDEEGKQETTIPLTTWESRTMLFMDALELDCKEDAIEDRAQGRLPDLKKDNVLREFRKAVVAFSAVHRGRGYKCVTTGLWGCGAFFGDPGVKMLLLWCAAATAGVEELHIVVDEARKSRIEHLEACVEMLSKVLSNPTDVENLLVCTVPRNVERGKVLEWLKVNYPGTSL